MEQLSLTEYQFIFQAYQHDFDRLPNQGLLFTVENLFHSTSSVQEGNITVDEITIETNKGGIAFPFSYFVRKEVRGNNFFERSIGIISGHFSEVIMANVLEKEKGWYKRNFGFEADQFHEDDFDTWLISHLSKIALIGASFVIGQSLDEHQSSYLMSISLFLNEKIFKADAVQVVFNEYLKAKWERNDRLANMSTEQVLGIRESQYITESVSLKFMPLEKSGGIAVYCYLLSKIGVVRNFKVDQKRQTVEIYNKMIGHLKKLGFELAGYDGKVTARHAMELIHDLEKVQDKTVFPLDTKYPETKLREVLKAVRFVSKIDFENRGGMFEEKIREINVLIDSFLTWDR